MAAFIFVETIYLGLSLQNLGVDCTLLIYGQVGLHVISVSLSHPFVDMVTFTYGDFV